MIGADGIVKPGCDPQGARTGPERLSAAHKRCPVGQINLEVETLVAQGVVEQGSPDSVKRPR